MSVITHHATIDGANMGMIVDNLDPSLQSNGVRVTANERRSLWTAIQRLGVDECEDGKFITVLLGRKYGFKSVIAVDLRSDGRRNGWFLNVRGNPISARTGQNIRGSLEFRGMLQWLFRSVLNVLARHGANVDRLKKQVEAGNISLQSVAFAVPSNTFDEDVLVRMIDHWHFMFEHRLQMVDQGPYISLAEELRLVRDTGDQFVNSLGFSIYRPGVDVRSKKLRGRPIMRMCVYNKMAELEDTGEEYELSEEDINRLKRQVRFDLTVHSEFFRRNWDMEIITVKSLYERVQEKFDGSWQKAISSLMWYAINRSCLQYMFTAPNPFLEKNAPMVAKWSEARSRGEGLGTKKFTDAALVAWASNMGIDLKVSPEAHYLMCTGQVALATNKKKHAQLWLSGAQGRARYLSMLNKKLQDTAENKRLVQAANDLRLSFGRVQ